MKTFLLIIMVFVSAEEGALVTAPFDTLNDCETAAAIISVLPSIMGAECETITTAPEGDPVGYGSDIEQGV